MTRHFGDFCTKKKLEDIDKLDNIHPGWLHPLPAPSILPSYPPSVPQRPERPGESKLPPAAACRLEDQRRPHQERDPGGIQDVDPAQDRAWVDMQLHESHEEGGFGVSHNTITRHAASYTTNARFVASWAPLHALLSRSGCQATTSRTSPHGMPPLSARSSACMGTSCSSTTAPSKP